MDSSQSNVNVTAVVAIGARRAHLAELYAEYQIGLSALGVPFEVIFVLDGPDRAARTEAQELQRENPEIRILGLSRSFGEATALAAGFAHARGDIILTLPAYHQIEGSEIGALVAALDSADMAVGRRWPRAGGKVETFRRAAFHWALGTFTRSRFRDLGCGARAMRRVVTGEISVYGDQHRFLPLLAQRQGFRVVEIDVRQSPRDRFDGRYGFKDYAHRALDILTVLFLVRFTKKPLRFFGMLGVSTFIVGSLLVAYLVVERLFFAQPLAERPALLLGSLLVVLGSQLFALGLIGELIIFTHARDIKDYQVAELIEFPREPGLDAQAGAVGATQHA